ncbi:MAG: ribosome maturation factor RimM, partial [Bryobacteraceae bacterium]
MKPQAQSQWVTIAVLTRVRGIRGELAAVPYSMNAERFQDLNRVFLFGDGSEFAVESVWTHGRELIFKFAGIESIEDAEPWRRSEVRVPIEERAPLEQGEFFHSDLIGCEVVDRGTGLSLGVVTGYDDGSGSGLLEVGKS